MSAFISGFLVANRGEGEHQFFRYYGQHGAGWTRDRSKALRLARREDAEALAMADDDTCRVLPVVQLDESSPLLAGTVRFGVALDDEQMRAVRLEGVRFPDGNIALVVTEGVTAPRSAIALMVEALSEMLTLEAPRASPAIDSETLAEIGLRNTALRIQGRIDAARERGSEVLGISIALAGEVVRFMNAGADRIDELRRVAGENVEHRGSVT